MTTPPRQLQITSVVGNPRADSRTHGLARELAAQLAGVLPGATTSEVDLAALGPKVLDWADADAAAATDLVLAADVLIIASPTFKATYSGLLKAFLDRIGGGALGGVPAIGLLLGGAPDHQLAVDVHLAPLLLELGASIPARGLFVVESDVGGFPRVAAGYAAANGPALAALAARASSQPSGL